MTDAQGTQGANGGHGRANRRGSIGSWCARAVAILALATAWAIASAPGALADREVVHDPRGDFENFSVWADDDLDIIMAIHRHRGSERLRHAITVAGSSPHAIPRAGEPGPPILVINTRPGGDNRCKPFEFYAGDSPADYVIAPVTRESEPVLIDCRTGQSMRVGARKAGEDRFVYTFKKDRIGNPRVYRWYAHNFYDVVPNAPMWMRHRLRKPPRDWRRCGRTARQGAGAFRITALRVGCKQARRVARRFTRGKNLPTWNCRSRRVGAETSRVRCVNDRKQRRQVVRFHVGA